jgi:signal transduction histidine kinase
MMADIDMRIECLAAEDRVVANNQQIRQVLINLLMNAADAIDVDADGSDGHILLETRSDNRTASTASPGFHIEVNDNGAGIPPEHMDNIFDPFYTTKDPGKGTGLGLSVCYMIVDGLGGRIRARNLPEGGSRFTISLPLPPADAPAPTGKEPTTDA